MRYFYDVFYFRQAPAWNYHHFKHRTKKVKKRIRK